MPVKVSYYGHSSAAEYRAALAEYRDADDSRFDAVVRRLAPHIRQLREDSARRSTRKLVERLNAMGQHGPNGKPITPSTMRRILLRLQELHLGEGPSDRSTAARDRRATRYYPRQSGPIKVGGLKKALSDIAEAEGEAAGGPAQE